MPQLTEVRVLAVCTGNICRSPATELLLRDAFTGQDGIAVRSAGVWAQVGQPVSPTMAELLRRAGIDPGGFAATALTTEDVRCASLVLGLAREHRTRAATLHPPALRYAYTLKEFARLVQRVPHEQVTANAGSAVPAARLAALARLAGRYRAPVPAAEDDITDPYGEDSSVHATVLAEIWAAVNTIARVAQDL